MEKMPSTFFSLVITLTVITLVASVSLGFVYQWTKEPIAQAQLKKQLKAIEAVVPGYTNNPIEEKFYIRTEDGIDSLECYPARKESALIGMAIKTYSAKGYSGDIWIMVGFTPDGTIQNIVVIDHKETPGLGSKMTSPAFVNQYIGKNPGKDNLKVKKDGGTVDAIAGATISSRAYTEAVMRAYTTYIQSSVYGTAE
ncbi:MAG: RnfABCDGE type electron transport complex subunit G [Cyclobacteriaceae bacterium]|nr:RnfABCDGE type electron transport complex subunit G [Cyclobacteriaceae bacterium]